MHKAHHDPDIDKKVNRSLVFSVLDGALRSILFVPLMFKLMSVGPRRGLQLLLIGKAKKNRKPNQESGEDD